MNFNEVLSGCQLALRVAVAGAFAVAIAKQFAFDFPIFAFISAVLSPIYPQQKVEDQVFTGLLLLSLGAAWGAVLTPILPSGPIAIGFGVLVAMATCHALIGVGGARVAAFLCGIILLDNGATPWAYAFHRLVETILGIVVAWGVSFVPKLFSFDKGA